MIPDKNTSDTQAIQTTLENDKNQKNINAEDCFNKINMNTNYYSIEIKNCDSTNKDLLNIVSDELCTLKENCNENHVISKNLAENPETYDKNSDFINNKITKDNTVTMKSCHENYSSSNSYVENCSNSNHSCNDNIVTRENCDQNTTIAENCDSESLTIESCLQNTPTCDKNRSKIKSCKENTASIESSHDKITATVVCDKNTAATNNCYENNSHDAINNSCDLQFESQKYEEIVTPQPQNEHVDIDVMDSAEGNGYKTLDNSEKSQANKVKIWVVELDKIVYHKCDACPKIFLNVDDLITHKKNHEERFLEHVISSYVKVEQFTLLDKKFVCSHNNCSQCFPTKRELLLHKVKHIQQSVKHDRKITSRLYEDNNIEKPYKCELCDFRFAAESTLNAHASVHEPFPHVCSCGVGFYQQDDLKAHKRLVHYTKPEVVNIEPLHDIPKLESPKITEPIKVKFQFHKKKRIRGMLQLEVDIMQRQKSGSKSARNEKKQCKVQTPLQFEINAMKQHTKISSLDVEFLKTINKRFKCPECKKDFHSKAGAKNHYYAIHTDERPYSCKVCGKSFTQGGALTIHLWRHLGVKNFPCHYCDKSFYDLGAQKLHERTHSGYKPYNCEVCRKKFSDPAAFQRHMRIHTGDRRYKCPYCPNAYTDNSQLYIHRKRHENNRNFTCDKCEKKFYCKSDLKKHISIVHNYVYNFPCKHCGKAFSTKNNMQFHINKLHNSSRKTYNCPICFKTLLEPAYLKRHMEFVHRKREKKFVCKHCCHVFAFNSQLQRHMVVHNKVKRFECDHCGSRFGAKGDVFRHMLQHHSSIKCDYCLKHFSSTSELKEHVLSVAERCDICDGEFFCKKSLHIHFRTHIKRDSAKFVCDHCGIKFSKRQKIVQHILHNHSPRKYVCDHCKQRFSHKASLRSHMISYHMDKLRCNICYKAFISILDLQKHKKLGCTVEKYTCDVCNKTLTTLSGFRSHKRRHTGDGGKCKCPMCGVKRSSKSSIVRHLRLVHGKTKKRHLQGIVPTE